MRFGLQGEPQRLEQIDVLEATPECPELQLQLAEIYGVIAGMLHPRASRSQLQLQASRAAKAEASALQWLVALPPFTAPLRKAAIPWTQSTQATLQQLAVESPDLRIVVINWRASVVELATSFCANHGLR